MFGFLQDPATRNIVIVIGVIVLFHLLIGSKKEGFASEEKAMQEGDSVLVLEKNMKQEEIPIKPTYVNTDVRSLMSGSGFIPQEQISGPWSMEDNTNKYGIIDGLDDGANGSLGLHFAMMSPSCCSEQYPPSFPLKTDKFICNNKDKFGPSPFIGNNAWQDSGCVCTSTAFLKHMSERGGNA
jgi:hypothetical protein